MSKKQKNLLIRVIIAILLVVIIHIFEDSFPVWYAKLLAFLVPYIIVGYDIIKKAFKGIKNKQVFDENFLMTIATLGALGVGIYNALSGGEDDYMEAVSVMLLYQIGELFQSYAIGKSRKNISELMDIRPDYANIDVDGKLVKTDPDEVEIGTIIVVNPGEKVPIDGVVVSGNSTINTAALTGESVPRDVEVDSVILSGCVNLSGVLKIRTTTEFDESTASKILELVENAASKKSKSENFISKFARYYTPVVCYAALALVILPPLFFTIIGQEAQLMTWVYRACTFLVISCPCAVVISIPLSFFAGLGGASNCGILIKGSNYLEALSKVKLVAFDKTGTITKGNFVVSSVHEPKIPEDELLYYAAHIESASSHPIAQSLKRAYGKEIYSSAVENIEEISGEGIMGLVDGKDVVAGNEKLMKRLGIDFHNCHVPGTIIHIALDGKYAGHIHISDEIKDDSIEAIRSLKESGVKRTIMLTGDGEAVAKSVCEEVGIDEYYAKLLPSDKVSIIEKILGEKNEKENLAFVGDGINDAPVLTRADIGIAMGALGSDAAIEAADVVLMDDDPLKISKAIRISQKCLTIVKENIIFSMGIKVICLALGAVGIANMWLAIMADTGVMILAVLNAIRALFVKKL